MEENTEDKIAQALSTQIIIKAQYSDGIYYPVGAIRKFNVIQDRQIRREEWYDDENNLHVELIPGSTSTIINLERVVFDNISMIEAFGQGYFSIAAQENPFNIQVESIAIINGCESRITITYHNCLFSSMSTPIKKDSYTILESATFVCERIEVGRN